MKETILVLDDSTTNLMVMTKYLERLGYQVITAENGEEGMKCVERCETQGLNLVAVISDLLMPLVDGQTFAWRLREESRYEELPIVFMTTATDKSYLLAAKKVKAAGYILKPVAFDQVVDQLKEIFPDREFPNFKAS